MSSEDFPRPPRVLVIDDDAGVRRALRDLLEDEDIPVQEAEDGLRGLERAGEFRPDVVVVDLRMPQIDGIETTRRLKVLVPDAQVILCTAEADQVIELGASRAGAFACIPKGTRPRLLLETVERAWAVKQGLERAGR
jgi:CheY-like chemotaxis protein